METSIKKKIRFFFILLQKFKFFLFIEMKKKNFNKKKVLFFNY
jgi:hypothetical protein